MFSLNLSIIAPIKKESYYDNLVVSNVSMTEDSLMDEVMELQNVPVWVVDDDDVRYSIQFALSTLGIQCVTYSSGLDFLKEVNLQNPGCLIMDTHMNDISGKEVFEKLRQADSPIKVIFFSGEGTTADAVEAMENGAISYLMKPIYPDELVNKIQVARTKTLEALEHCQARVLLKNLSPREVQIFPLICEGRTSEEIAEMLYLSRRTLEVHRLNISRKFEKRAPASILYKLCKDRLPENILHPRPRRCMAQNS